MGLIKKNELQMRFLHGNEATNALREAVKETIKKGNYETISFDTLEELDAKIEKLIEKKSK